MRSSANFPVGALITPERYDFLHILDLARTGEHSRKGWFAFTIDGWPIALPFTMIESEQVWAVQSIDGLAVQRNILQLLGLKGLPKAMESKPWKGGLSGFDKNGWPMSSVLLGVNAGIVFIGGTTSVSYAEEAVTKGLREQFNARTNMAKAVHATYTPHVAIYLDRRAPTPMLADLVQWSLVAGAKAIRVLVKRPDGSPGFIPLARTLPAPPGRHPQSLQLRIDRK